MNEVRYCRKCGNELNSDDRFCNKCGAKTTGNGKKKKNIILVLCIVVLILGIVGCFYIGNNKSFYIFSQITGQNNYDEEIETIKSLLANKINSNNAEVMRKAEVNAETYSKNYKRTFKVDTTQAKYSTLTEGLLNVKLEENYKNRNIFCLTSKSSNGFESIYISKWAVYESKIIVSSYKYDEIYAYLEDGDIKYSPNLDVLKEGIDKTDRFSENPMYETYKKVVDDVLKTKRDVQYGLIDINNDKIQELIILSGESNADFKYSFYTYIDNKAIKIGEIYASTSILYKMNNGNYLKQVKMNMRS